MALVARGGGGSGAEAGDGAIRRGGGGEEMGWIRSGGETASTSYAGRRLDIVPPSSQEELDALCETVEDVVRYVVGYLEVRVAETAIILDDLFDPFGFLPARLAHAVVMWSPISMGGKGRIGILLKTNPDAMLGYSLAGIVAEPQGAVTLAVAELCRRMLEEKYASLMPTMALFRLCLSRMGQPHDVIDKVVGAERIRALAGCEIMNVEERGLHV